MKIESAEVIVTSPSRNFVTLRITTSDGVVGLGDATLYTFENGLLNPGEAPGLGVELDLEAAAHFPYQSAYLPVNRLRDRTVHDW